MNRKIPSLDGLRAISISIVLLGHLAGTRNGPAFPMLLASYAQLGVVVFFVISGYLITTLLMQEEQKNGTISLKNFYARRALRILPAAYVFTTICVLWFHKYLLHIEVIGAYLYFENFVYHSWQLAHLWSLSIEEQFYLVWPAVYCLGIVRSRKVAIWTILICPFARVLCYYAGLHDIFRYSFTVADTLATGCLLAIVANSLHRYDYVLLKRKMALLLLAFILLVHLGYATHAHGLGRFYASFGESCMLVAIALLIYNAVHCNYAFLNGRAIKMLGVLSYSLYLWQQIFLNRESNAWYTAFQQNLFFAFAAALGSYWLVEKPILRLRARWHQSRPSSSRTVAIAVAD